MPCQSGVRERERLPKRAVGDFERSLELMRSKDSQLREDGFSLLGPLPCAHIEELMTKFRNPAAVDQSGILELIADFGSGQASTC